MKITDLCTNYMRIPVETALVNKTKSRAFMEVITLKIITDEGLVGYGYSYTDGFGGRAIQTVIETDIRDLIIGKDPMCVKELSRFCLWELRQAGSSGVTVLGVAAMDLALWDIYSQAVGLPISTIWGAYRDRVPMYASVAGWATLPPEEMAARAKELYDMGMTGIKLQVGRTTPDGDARRIEILRETLGKEAKIFIDANTILGLPQAIKLAKRLEEYDIFWFEEPIPLLDKEGHKLLGQHTTIPLAVGENFYGYGECHDFITDRLVSYMQTDVIRIGGPTEWMRVAALADSYNVRMSPHFVMEVTTEVQCCVQNSLFVEYIPWFQAYFKDPIRTENGFAYARTKPGLGLEFDEAAVKAFTVE